MASEETSVELVDELQEVPPRFVGYRKITIGLLIHASTSALVYLKTIPAEVYGDITIALILALLGSNVLAKFANVLGEKRYGASSKR